MDAAQILGFRRRPGGRTAESSIAAAFPISPDRTSYHAIAAIFQAADGLEKKSCVCHAAAEISGGLR
jgi:hypothetical protein